MDLCIVDVSGEIPTRCSFVTEYIIPKFIEGSTCFGHPYAHHQEPINCSGSVSFTIGTWW
jgi:hypothetical protein